MYFANPLLLTVGQRPITKTMLIALPICSTMSPSSLARLLCLILALVAGMHKGAASEPDSIAGLEQRLADIDRELGQLARPSMRSGRGSISWRSFPSHRDAHHTEWFQIELGEPRTIDMVVLVPAIWRDSQDGPIADGFPEEFRVLAGKGNNSEAEVIASFNKADGLLPRAAPLVIPCQVEATWIRVEATVLSARRFDGFYNLELAELMAFEGEENVALHCPVTVSGRSMGDGGARQPRYLVDGFMPYNLDSSSGNGSAAGWSKHALEAPVQISFDLGGVHELNQINLHAVDIHDTVPHDQDSGSAFPRELVVEGALKADFSDAVPLCRYTKDPYKVGPIVMLQFPKRKCRYVRLRVLRPERIELRHREQGDPEAETGFAEIELLAGGKNVALGRVPRVIGLTENIRRPLANLSDGHNIRGVILPLRQWMEQLARRHELERARPLIAAELQGLYADQKAKLRYLGWVIAFLAGAVVFLLLIDRLLRMRQAARLKERFAADLHDELGANLHTIVLLGDVAAKKSNALPEEISSLIQRMQATAKRSVFAVEHVTDLQSAGRICKNLPVDMRRAAERIVVDLKHDFSVEGEEHLARVHPRDQVNLFLFYKECLINSCRHSGATELSTRLVIRARNLELTVTDNGSDPEGTGDADSTHVPESLQRRAKFLRARVSRSRPVGGGSCITLRMRTWNHWLRPR